MSKERSLKSKPWEGQGSKAAKHRQTLKLPDPLKGHLCTHREAAGERLDETVCREPKKHQNISQAQRGQMEDKCPTAR